jgi:hypothetical protein
MDSGPITEGSHVWYHDEKWVVQYVNSKGRLDLKPFCVNRPGEPVYGIEESALDEKEKNRGVSILVASAIAVFPAGVVNGPQNPTQVCSNMLIVTP